MRDPFHDRVGRQRGGVRFAEASVASRSEADPTTLRGWTAPLAPARRQVPSASKPMPIPGWAHAAAIRVPQLADQKAAEVNAPLFSAAALESHSKSNEGFAHEALAPSPADLSIAAHPPHRPIARIAQFQTALLPRSRTINLCRRPLPQSFVRPNLIVGLDPAAGPALLSPQMRRRRSRRLGLEHPMHLSVPGVLFRMPRRNELHTNPHRRPPRAQSRKPRWPLRSKGTTVVHTDDFRMSVLPEQLQEYPPNRPPTLVPQQSDGQQVSTEQISYRQRFDPLPVLGPKPAFEIHGPYPVAPPRSGERSALHQRPPPTPGRPPPRQFQASQPFVDHPRRRNPLPAMFPAQPSGQLAAAPTAMSPAQSSNSPQPFSRDLPRRMVGAARPIPQPSPPVPFEASLPFVARPPTHLEQPTQPRHALLGLQSQLHKLLPLCQTRDLFPRHGRGKGTKGSKKCYPCLCAFCYPCLCAVPCEGEKPARLESGFRSSRLSAQNIDGTSIIWYSLAPLTGQYRESPGPGCPSVPGRRAAACPRWLPRTGSGWIAMACAA